MKWLTIFFLLLVACEDKPEYMPKKPQVIRMAAGNQDVTLPSRLWEELEAVYRPPIFEKASSEENDSKAKLEIPKDFFSFHIYLKEKSAGILTNRNGYDLSFGAGGGTLDMQEFVQQKRGSFYFGFRPELEVEKDDVFKVFYLSNSRLNNIEGQLHGSGCDKYLDISDYFRNKMTGEGILLSASEGRHVSLMAGTYFFATSLKGKLYLSQLTIKDSRFKKLHCTFK